MRTGAPLVTVVMPCYNSELYLEAALNSILDQSYKNLEILVVDDCSTDSTGKIIRNFAKKDKRIIHHTNLSNLGLIDTLNLGISMANGKYICRMDSDDISHLDRVSLQVAAMENDKNLVICGGGIKAIRGDAKSSFHFRLYPKKTDQIKAEALYNTPFAHPCVLIRRDVFLKYGLQYDANYKYAEDFHLWQRLITKGASMNIERFLLTYRVVPGSQTAVGTKKMEDRFHTVSKIQAISLNRIHCSLNEKEKRLHFILSLTEYIKAIDLNEFPPYFILNYMQKINKCITSSKYCSITSGKVVLSRKYIKYLIFNWRKMTLLQLLSSISTGYFVRGLVLEIVYRLKVNRIK